MGGVELLGYLPLIEACRAQVRAILEAESNSQTQNATSDEGVDERLWAVGDVRLVTPELWLLSSTGINLRDVRVLWESAYTRRRLSPHSPLQSKTISSMKDGC